MHRFRFIGEANPEKKLWFIADDEHVHLAKILRLNIGTIVEVTDGHGHWVIGPISHQTSSTTHVTPTESYFDALATPTLNLAIGALNHGEVDEIIAPLTELGVDKIWVFGQDEQSKARLSEKALDRWQRLAQAAVKQCKRAYFPMIQLKKNAATLIETELASQNNEHVGLQRRFVAAADGDAFFSDNLLHNSPASTEIKAPLQIESVWAVVGSEKGLSPGESALFSSAGFQPVRIGKHVLRAKTASVACAAMLASIFRR